jgi:adenylylsulfate kinase-like enzyme
MAGSIRNFTGKDSGFEVPQQPDLVLDTEAQSLHECVIDLVEALQTRVSAH